MNKTVVIVALCLIFFIFFAVVVTLQFRNENKKKPTPSPSGCQSEGLDIISLTATQFDHRGQIAPTQVYLAHTTFHVSTADQFHSGGVLFEHKYPNENENGVLSGFSIVDVESGNANSIANVPCAVGWNMSGGPNSSTCNNDAEVKGWSVVAGAVKSWWNAPNITHIQTLTSPSENKFTVKWDPIEGVDVYAVSLTLVGDSYDSENNIVSNTLSFGGLTSSCSIKLSTVGSNHFTADVPTVGSVKVVGFHHCDLGKTVTTCLGVEL
jgi:hypothetical protein